MQSVHVATAAENDLPFYVSIQVGYAKIAKVYKLMNEHASNINYSLSKMLFCPKKWITYFSAY